MAIEGVRERMLAIVRAAGCVLAALTVSSAMSASRGGVESRHVRFTANEGTWVSLDVSPDGRSLVFELVGDLYTMPVSGGPAQRLTSGSAFDAQPRYSPDGRSIAFVSDRSGADNIWLMDVPSGELRALTHDTESFFISPEWSPAGDEIVVSKSTRSTGHGREYQLFTYALDAGGSGRQLTGVASSSNAAGGPAPTAVLGATFGKDPRRLFASIQRPAKWPSFGEWQVAAIDLATGAIEPFTDELNGAMRPLLSPDGRSVIYGTRWNHKFRLKLVDLQSREARWLAPELDRDAEDETAPRRDLFPGAAFTPDGQALLIAYQGKIQRVSLTDGAATVVPFSADVDVELAPLAQFEYPLRDDNVVVRRIEQAQRSPDGRWLAFSALNRIWVQRLGEGARSSRAISSGSDGAFFPAWSPDGRYLAYVTWNDLEGGAIWRAD
ncbi:MAG: PD40 domain-containing protein, partial [Steroidobacter sp.]|nr:PD40 domain-containing protein [Steroidobacter sp.]